MITYLTDRSGFSFGSGVISPPPSTDPAPSTDSGNSGETPAPTEGSGGDDQSSPSPATDDQSAPATDASSDDTPSSGSDDSNSDSAPGRRRSFRFARDLNANATSITETTDSTGANSTTITYSGNNSTTVTTMSQQMNATVADDSTSEGNTTDINTAIGQAIDVADGTTGGTDDFAYGSIVDFSGKYVLGVSDDGNFYIDTIANQAQTIGFAFDQSVAIEDEESDLLFYYPDEM